MRMSKMLGVALLAVLAMAVSAAAASAEVLYHVEGTTGPFTVKGAQVAEENHVFTIEAGLETKCKNATFEGTVAEKTVKKLVVAPVYNECTAFGLAAEVKVHACKYEFLQPNAEKVANVNVVNCAAGEPAQLITGTCELTVGNQENKAKVTFENEATTPKQAKVKAAVERLKYNKVKDGFLCPLNGTGEKEDGTYKGDTQEWAFEGAVQKGVFVE